MDGEQYSEYYVEELFYQKRCLEEIKYEYVSEEILDEALKKVQEKIDKIVKII